MEQFDPNQVEHDEMLQVFEEAMKMLLFFFFFFSKCLSFNFI